jgi:hypothetical protein
VQGSITLAAAVALALAGCTGGEPTDDEGSPVPPGTDAGTSTSQPPSAQPSTAPSAGAPVATAPSAPGSTNGDGTTPEPAFVADTARDTGEAAGGDVGTLTDLRVGAHDGYDRVVLELDGPGTPAWDVRYVAEPLGDASGLPVAVEGDAALEVTLHPVAVPVEGAEPGPATVRGSGTAVVVEAVRSSLFEGYLQVFVGVHGGQHPFRAYALTDPARIVVDVSTS